MADFEIPEVQRTALESTALKVKVYGFGDIVDTFRRFLDPPPTPRVLGAIERLKATRALDEDLQLTPLGRFLGQLPLDVELGKILAFGAFYGCIDPCVTIAAYLSASVQLFESGNNWQSGGSSGGSITRELLHGRSDLLTYYHIFRTWKAIMTTQGMAKARVYCAKHSLNAKSLSIVDDTRSQLLSLLPFDFDACNRFSGNLDMVHTALLAAAYPNVMKMQNGSFVSARGPVSLHGSSIFAGETAAAIVASIHAEGLQVAGVEVSSAMAARAATASRDLSPFYCYFTCLHATQLSVFDATNVHPLLVAFAVGCQSPLAVNHVGRILTFDKDGIAKVRMANKTASHLVEFHKLLTLAFEQFLLNPREPEAPGVGDVVGMLHAILSTPAEKK
ncbi:helicase associated domain-containing protein [Blastocladiella britannica]|nr:helicase associated domain-containing protein [Blastocladiella britannica]